MVDLPANSDFGARLKRLLAERGLRNQDLARKLGVSANTVSGWTSRGSIPKSENLQGIAQALGTNVDVLLGDEAGPEPGTTEPERLIGRLAELGLEPTVRAFAAAAPDLMAILSEAQRQVEQLEASNQCPSRHTAGS